jgi:SAM-dependent methyltransferase
VGRFESTAPWYARFRPRYPAELIERLAGAAGLDAGSRVLDLGAGPGHVASAMAAHVGEVVAVDVEAGMLAQIEEPNVRTVVGPAEDVDASWGWFDLVTAGRSFHWFDAGVMFARLPLVTDQLALLGDSITESNAQSRVLAIATEVLGEEPPKPRRRFYRELLSASPFSEVEEIEVTAERTWTAESLIGLAYSTSTASPERLGAEQGEFERRVRATFGDAEYHERVSVGAAGQLASLCLEHLTVELDDDTAAWRQVVGRRSEQAAVVIETVAGRIDGLGRLVVVPGRVGGEVRQVGDDQVEVMGDPPEQVAVHEMHLRAEPLGVP